MQESGLKSLVSKHTEVKYNLGIVFCSNVSVIKIETDSEINVV